MRSQPDLAPPAVIVQNQPAHSLIADANIAPAAQKEIRDRHPLRDCGHFRQIIRIGGSEIEVCRTANAQSCISPERFVLLKLGLNCLRERLCELAKYRGKARLFHYAYSLAPAQLGFNAADSCRQTDDRMHRKLGPARQGFSSTKEGGEARCARASLWHIGAYRIL